MKKALLIACLGGALPILLIAVILRGDKEEPQKAAGQPDTVLKINLDFKEDSGKTDKQKLTLACKGDKPTPQTKGRNLDMPSQAVRACKLLGVLKKGVNTCPALSRQGNTYGLALIEGTLRGKQFKAEYENNSGIGCMKQRQEWFKVEQLWTLSGKGDTEAGKRIAEKVQKQREVSKQREEKHKQELKKLRMREAETKRENEKYLAPDVKITGEPAKPAG